MSASRIAAVRAGAPPDSGSPAPGEADVAVVRPAARLRGELRLPGDKSVSHRALMLAALAEGT